MDELPRAPERDHPLHFTLGLAGALHRFGTPAHRLEEALAQVSARLGIEARFFSTPTSIFASFGKPEHLRTVLVRVEPGEFDIARLTELDALATEVIRGEVTAAEGTARVEAILARPERWGPGVRLACHALAGASAAVLFGGGPAELALAMTIALFVGGLAVAAGGRPAVARIVEPVGGFGAAAIAVAAARLAPPVSEQVATISGLIVLLPGLSLTIAMTELATRNLISGASRLTGTAVSLLSLGFGIALGGQLAMLLPPAPATVPSPPFPAWTVAPALLGATLALTVLFRARARDGVFILAAGVVAFVGARVGATLLGRELGAFLGALLLGAFGNVLGRVAGRPALTAIVPGLMLLVPGSMGMRSVESLLHEQVEAGVQTAFRMLFVAVALVAGLLVANALVPPRRLL